MPDVYALQVGVDGDAFVQPKTLRVSENP